MCEDPAAGILKDIVTALEGITDLDEVNRLLVNFLNKITPALDTIGKWIVRFGPKIQAFVSQLGTTVDRAQKTFDKMLMKLQVSSGVDKMIHASFNLYDLKHQGYVTLFDVQEVGRSYAIDAYQGDSGKKLFEKYAGHNDRLEKGPEFAAFVNDPTVPYGMATLLRQYAKDIAQIGGELSRAVRRADMSKAVGNYLTLTCARNLTKVGWVTQTLTNGTLPLKFTACVMIELALLKDDPNKVTLVDTGAMALGAMMVNNMTSVMDATDYIHDPKFFTEQGFDVSEQPKVLEILTHWFTMAPALWEKMIHTVVMLEVVEKTNKTTVPLTSIFKEMPAIARRLASGNIKKYKEEQALSELERRRELFGTSTKRMLALHLAGGKAFTGLVPVASAASQVVHGGANCSPVTLMWAKWLAANASHTAKHLYGISMDYAKTSSSTTDSFNTQIQSITKKISSFIKVMEKYATPQGIATLKKTIEDFEFKAMHDVLHLVEKKIIGFVTNVINKSAGTNHNSLLAIRASTSANRSALKTQAGTAERARHILALIEDKQQGLQMGDVGQLFDPSHGVWKEVQTVLTEMIDLLPSGVKTLTTAKSDVQQVSSTLESMFNNLQDKGPPIFANVSGIYLAVWIAYYILIVIFTLSILVYAFWAHGWCGGQAADPGQEYAPPKSFMERCDCCWRCFSCIYYCCGSEFTFWSAIISMEFIALLLLLVSILFVIVGGIGIFLANGCSQIYVVTDETVCQTTMGFLKEFVPDFSVGKADGLNPLTAACANHNLLVCEMISSKLVSSAKYTIIGSFFACIFTFQLILDAAILHERARWSREREALIKDI
jgi:hypothetical protein